MGRRGFLHGLLGAAVALLGLGTMKAATCTETKMVKFTVHNFSSKPPFPRPLRSPDGWVCVWETMTVPRSRRVSYQDIEVDLWSADVTWCYEREVTA